MPCASDHLLWTEAMGEEGVQAGPCGPRIWLAAWCHFLGDWREVKLLTLMITDYKTICVAQNVDSGGRRKKNNLNKPSTLHFQY